MKIKKAVQIIIMLGLILYASTSCKNGFIDSYSDMDDHLSETEENWMETAFFQGMSDFSYHETNDSNSASRINVNVNDIIKRYADNKAYLQVDINKVPHYYDMKNDTFIGCCIDPLCDHTTEDCPFFGSVDGCILYDNKMFFTKLEFDDDSDYDKVYCYYDMANKNVVPLRGASLGRSILTQVYYDNYCYYYDVLPNEDSDVWSVNFLRQNISTKKTEVLDLIEGYQNQVFFARDGKLYYNDESIGQLYYTTTENVTKREVMLNNSTHTYMYDDDYLYFIEVFDSGESRLSRIGFDGSDYKTYDLCDVANYYIVGDCVYYMDNNRVEIKIEDGGYITISSRNIYRYNMMTGEQETVITLDEGLSGVDVIDYIVDGNYVYMQFQLTENGRDYYSVGGVQGILRIDLENESYYYISPNKDMS